MQENVCLTLLPKNAHEITQRPTRHFSDADVILTFLLPVYNSE